MKGKTADGSSIKVKVSDECKEKLNQIAKEISDKMGGMPIHVEHILNKALEGLKKETIIRMYSSQIVKSFKQIRKSKKKQSGATQALSKNA